MALVPVKMPEVLPPPTPAVSKFIAAAQTQIDAFIEAHLSEPIHSFVPSDYPMVYGALRHIADANLAPGKLFCEWGSGAGVVACLAAMIGFDSCGIEFERELVELSVALARRHHVNVGFIRGNFVPPAGQEVAEDVGEFEWLAVGGTDPYELMELDIDDFDVIFAYPWPGEEHVVERLFELFAADGALLVTYNGSEGVRVFRQRRRTGNGDATR